MVYSAAANHILSVVEGLVDRPERDKVISESIAELCVAFALLTGKPLTMGMLQEKKKVNNHWPR